MSQRRHNADRMWRADSWLRRAERAERDRKRGDGEGLGDAGPACEQFMFLWIAFNAAYGYQLVDESASAHCPERKQFTDFLREVVDRDREKIIENILWRKFAGPVRNLVENKYVFSPFWEWVRGSARGKDRESEFYEHKKIAQECLAELNKNNATRLLEIVFLQLYTLRNQAFHGGMTFAEGWGGNQVKNGCHIMAALVPTILDIMRADIEKTPDTTAWGKVAYPRINDRKD